jgi:methylated-DNA-protein-cysteine methyltransferase-like protein
MAKSEASEFAEKVYKLVGQIPAGRVMTYGQIAALAGSVGAARVVGGIAHFGPESLPWHRVVNKSGGLAAAYPGGRQAQEAKLKKEGIKFYNGNCTGMNDLVWWPTNTEMC